MYKDRIEICDIISRMLNNPDRHGIFPTSTCYTELEHYIEQVRMEAIGWTHANDCVTLDKGGDPRIAEVPEMLERARTDLARIVTGQNPDLPHEFINDALKATKEIEAGETEPYTRRDK